MLPEDAERILSELSVRLPTVETPCPACRGTAIRSAFLRSGFRVVECDGCRTLYVTPRPTEESLLAVYRSYPKLADFGNEVCREAGGDNRSEIRYRLGRVLDARHSGRLLDVGCGRGEFLTAAGAHFEVYGVDVLPLPGPILQDAVHFTGPLEDARFESDSFDVVTAVEVLEHLFDPRRTLQEIHRIVKPGGVVMLQTGDADSLLARLAPSRWHYVRPPIHLTCFSRTGLMRLLTSTGFQKTGAWSFGRAPERLQIHRFTRGPEVLRPVLDWAGRLGLIGQLYRLARSDSG